MSIRIEIVINDDCPYEDVATAFETQMKAIGFVRDVPKAQARSDTIDTDADYASGDTISVESTGSGATASVYIAEGAIISSITGKPPTRIIFGVTTPRNPVQRRRESSSANPLTPAPQLS